MKICSISNGYPPYIRGGGETYVKDIAEKINNHGKHDFFNISISPKEEHYLAPDIVNGVKVYRLKPINLFNKYNGYKETFLAEFLWKFITIIDFITLFKVTKIIKKENPDLIHLNAFSFYSLFLPLVIRKKPMIYTIHGRNFKNKNFSSFMNKAYNYFQRGMFKNISMVISPSKALLKEFREEGFCKYSSLKVIPLYSKNKPQENIKSFGKPFIIFFMGTLDNNKGVDILIKAFNDIKDDFFELHIGGKGVLEAYVEKVANENRNIYYHGYLDAKMKDSLMKNVDVIVVPTKDYDNSPLVIYEAFSYGLPVVGSNIGGIPELIAENKVGILVNPKDSQDLKNKLIALSNNKIDLLNFSKNSLIAANKYSFNNHINDLILTYQEVLRGTD
ncbi:MAG: glycosyltransferase [Methanolobus sp.]|jgi:glycosyltransferase involved in cell wall biosynthesis|nr:glycosyltransferase [Methanolobus sp.]